MNKPLRQDDTATARPANGTSQRRKGMLTREREEQLARAWREDGSVEARNTLVTAFAPLAVSMARRHSGGEGGVDPELVQHAYIGLLKAADRFEPDLGYRFSTYAAWWIRAELQDYRMANWSIVRRGNSSRARKVFANLGRLDQEASAPGEGGPEAERRIAETLGVNLSALDRLRQQFAGNDISLNRPAVGEDGDEAIALLPDDDSDVEGQVARKLDRRQFYDLLAKQLDRLPAREREIVIATHLADPPKTLESLAVRFDLSKERIRQLRERALDRLRAGLSEAYTMQERPF
ncbi:MAG: sigma-70 family RNA polymerase sigma factor [Sediminimonas sp.]|uniref:sigma-70 family RNA polymerase sigma factor n=1 Tax=Sediminimonas sp. TaxID=2823379 RepID=UPI00287099A0|nr:sigma-70 family RNA polymerase sigma factor [Sediminimonas sp.]MDR9485409.1 sigma-70 family RNA polymerase sigma factor [Sediminimonas sp.]